MIKNRFLHYNTLQGFLRDRDEYGDLLYDKIVFIKDTKQIWTHNTFYDGVLSITTVDKNLSTTSTNPVQNKAITNALNKKADKTLLENYATDEDFYLFKESINTKTNKAKGYFDTYTALANLIPYPEVGDWAIVDNGDKWVICTCKEEGSWILTEEEYEHNDVDLNEYVKKDLLLFYVKKSDVSDIPTQETIDGKLDKLIAGYGIDITDNVISCTIIPEGGLNPEPQPTPDEPSHDGYKHIILEQEEYDTLTEYEENAIYFVLERLETNTWTFGGTFPITFTENSIGTFPIILA